MLWGLPGSGISYVDGAHGGSRGSSGGKRTAARAQSEPRPWIKVERPGLFASCVRERFAAGVRASVRGSTRTLRPLALFRESSDRDDRNWTSADDLMCGILYLTVKEQPGGRGGGVLRAGRRICESTTPDKLIRTYVRGLQFGVGVKPMMLPGAMSPRPHPELAVEMLARAYGELDRTDEAIGLLQKLHDLHPDEGLGSFFSSASTTHSSPRGSGRSSCRAQ